MNSDNIMVARWQINGVKTILQKLQETDEELSDLYFLLAESLNSALKNLDHS